VIDEGIFSTDAGTTDGEPVENMREDNKKWTADDADNTDVRGSDLR